MKKLLKIGACIFIVTLLSNCNNSDKVSDIDKDGVVDSLDTCPTEFAKTTTGCPKRIDKINFFIETSASMAGYTNGATDFAATIPNILIAIENKADSFKKPIHNYFIDTTIIEFSGKTEEFINELALRPHAKSKSSPMHTIFRLIADKTDSNDISIFVSDCILSYSDEEIKASKGREINREKAEAGLKPQITSTFYDLKKKNNMCASIYGFNSIFNGTYFTYQNAHIPIKNNANRPYYLWVLGNKDLVKKFNTQLKALEAFNPTLLSMDFGIFDKPIKDYKILFHYKKQGEWQLEPESNSITETNPTPAEPITLAIALDLSSLPDYARDTAYLREKLHLENQTADVKIKQIQLSTDVDIKSLKENERLNFDGPTHVLILQIDKVYKKEGNIRFNLPLTYNTSYRSLSTMDDRTIDSVRGKTFAFAYLVDGVRQAYEDKSQNFIDISVPIKR